MKGDIWQGITDIDRSNSWKQFGDFDRCRDCLFFPKCSFSAKCEGGNFCTYFNEYIEQYQKKVVEKVQLFHGGIS